MPGTAISQHPSEVGAEAQATEEDMRKEREEKRAETKHEPPTSILCDTKTQGLSPPRADKGMLVKSEDVLVETAPVEEAPTPTVEEPLTTVGGAAGAAVDEATSSLGEEGGNYNKPSGESATTNDDPELEKERPASPQMKAPHISTLYDKQVSQAWSHCLRVAYNNDGRG